MNKPNGVRADVRNEVAGSCLAYYLGYSFDIKESF